MTSLSFLINAWIDFIIQYETVIMGKADQLLFPK